MVFEGSELRIGSWSRSHWGFFQCFDAVHVVFVCVGRTARLRREAAVCSHGGVGRTRCVRTSMEPGGADTPVVVAAAQDTLSHLVIAALDNSK